MMVGWGGGGSGFKSTGCYVTTDCGVFMTVLQHSLEVLQNNTKIKAHNSSGVGCGKSETCRTTSVYLTTLSVAQIIQRRMMG
jgi:hypothetical protein